VQPTWLNYVDEKRRRNLVAILQELSKLQNKDNLNFIVIGALPLLINNYCHYIVYWDIDLLFRDIGRLKEFIKMPKSYDLKIVHYDDDLMVTENIASFHTAWSFDKHWFNVDYILRGAIFRFFTNNIVKLKLFTQSIKYESINFEISLYLAHPWDIFLEKVVSPRTKKEIELKVDMSVDIRHIFLIYQKEKDNIKFWQYVLKKAQEINEEKGFKERILKLLELKAELGYGDIEPSPLSIKMLS